MIDEQLQDKQDAPWAKLQTDVVNKYAPERNDKINKTMQADNDFFLFRFQRGSTVRVR